MQPESSGDFKKQKIVVAGGAVIHGEENLCYYAAAYLRLSREDNFALGKDGGSGTESNSISSQRDMIDSYVSKQSNMELYDIYADDGYSGTDFNRPEFKRMMEDIEKGRVNCVIVKDLSRLGRDYIEVGRLVQKTFPAFLVRFIAITDHFDSLTADETETAVMVPIKNFVNDYYAADISAKVRSHQRIKREKGEFIGAFAVYGYRKCEHNRNLLVPDSYAAYIVRRIFAWKMEGYSNLAIAGLLEERGVFSPMEYKKMRGEKLQTVFDTGVWAKWSAVAVKRILTNEIYTGTLVQGKEERMSYKIKKSVKKPREEWIRVPGTHEAIISVEDFEIVQDLLETENHSGNGAFQAHKYAGILFCGDCKKPMTRRRKYLRGKEETCYLCSTKNKGCGCSRHFITEKELEHTVVTELQQLSFGGVRGRIFRAADDREAGREETEWLEQELEGLRRRLSQYGELQAGLYEDFKNRVITEADSLCFGEIYEKRYEEWKKAMERQEEAIRERKERDRVVRTEMEQARAGAQPEEVERMTLIRLVKRVWVYEDKRIRLELRHRDEESGSVSEKVQ